MMDGDPLREELRKRIAQEVHAQFSAYRGAVSAELTFMDQELDTGLRAVQDKFASVGAEILESHAARVTRGIERGPIRTASPDVWGIQDLGAGAATERLDSLGCQSFGH